MSKLVIANWKMLPPTLTEAEALIHEVGAQMQKIDEGAVELVLCPPPVFLKEVAELLDGGAVAGAKLGAQDFTLGSEGALSNSGVVYVIIGHSDRRYKDGETDAMVNGKLKAALKVGLVPIVCLGERTREGAWQGALTSQLAGTLGGLSAEDVARCKIAYEPVWAISTNPGAKPDTPASAVQSMALIREALADRFDTSHPAFIYGGSVNAGNAHAFLQRTEISGVLVGGASVRSGEFGKILEAAVLAA